MNQRGDIIIGDILLLLGWFFISWADLSNLFTFVFS